MEAQRLGATVQERRVNALVQATLDRSESDDAAVISAIRSQVSALSEKAEPSTIDVIMAGHPDLPSAARASILMGMRSGKESLRHSLNDFERNPRPPGMTLRAWWEIQSAASENR